MNECMYSWRPPKIRQDSIFPRAESYIYHMLISHWLNIEYVNVLAADIAATAQASLENQVHMVCVCGRGGGRGR